MKIAVVGATGFIGRYVVAQAIEKGHGVVATGRSNELLTNLEWSQAVKYLSLDIKDYPHDPYTYLGKPDCIIYLAWPQLYGYQELYQIEENLPFSYHFLKALILGGLKDLIVTGTCYEYGKKDGELTEDLVTQPINAYAVAKDSLRKMLEVLQQKYSFSLRWARLFYIHGEGQSSNSFLPQLLKAIKTGDTEFAMSGGEQLRDFLEVDKCASMLVSLSEAIGKNGIFNCASGQPISVRTLAENCISGMNSSIKLNLGYYPYRSDEAMAFWGNIDKIKVLL
jgi:nucleoside-diphosphate-sugar epimerase